MKFYRFGNYTVIDFHCKIERCIIFYELEFLRIFLSLSLIMSIYIRIKSRISIKLSRREREG